MVVLNGMSRFHLAALAIKLARLPAAVAASLISDLNQRINYAVAYAREHFEDPPEIRDWRWSE
jgi:xylulose-5-phosphate/fructose-6-phosphate phosphoketolase